MNLALTIFLFSIFFTFPAERVDAKLIIANVSPGSPAEAAGLLPGDIILQTDPKFDIGDLTATPVPTTGQPSDTNNQYGGDPVESFSDLLDYTQANLGSEASLLVARGSTPVIVTLVPRVNPPPGEGPMGIGVGTTGGRIESKFSPSLKVIPESIQQSYEFVTALGDTVSNLFASDEESGLVGPIGIAQVTGEVASTGLLPFIGFAGILSLNLAIINILPIPALDGGRLLFVIIEAVRGGKRIPPQKEAIIHLMGFIVLIAFIIFVSFGDVQRLVRGDDILP